MKHRHRPHTFMNGKRPKSQAAPKTMTAGTVMYKQTINGADTHAGACASQRSLPG
jgi:hypothetical protein